VSDALFVVRRSSLGELPTKALKKKKLEVFDLLENLCVETSACDGLSPPLPSRLRLQVHKA